MRLPVLLSLALTSLAPAASEPLLHIPFDGSDQAVGLAEEALLPHATMSGPFTPGIKGQARRLGGANLATYYLDQGFLPARGTCSLWVQPLDWTAAVTHFVFFTSFSWTGAEGQYVRVLLYKVWNETAVTLLVQNTVGGDKASYCKAPIEFWRKGEWHHLAFTWDPDKYRLYVDGKPAGEAKTIPQPDQGRWEIRVGSPFEGWAYLGSESNAIDEYTIWPEALPAEEIKRMYDEVAPNLPPPPAESADDGPRRVNLALRDNGALVLASSFQDFSTFYTDNLIDGNADSLWRPFTTDLPQWLELRWAVPLRLSEVVLPTEKAGGLTAASVAAWEPGTATWRPLNAQSAATAEGLRLTFPETAAERLRINLEQGDAKNLALREVAVYGPPQPLLARLKPYWKASYIWYPEPDKVYKPNEPRYFRSTFEVADPAKVRSAILQLRSNDRYRAWMNGVEVAAGSTAISPIEVKPRLVAGKNVLAVEAELLSNPGRWTWGELLYELALNYDDRTDYVTSDSDTLTSATKSEGWLTAGFGVDKWVPAAKFVTPPDGVWGEIPYHARPVGEQATFVGLSVSPARPQPGDAVTVSLKLQPGAALRDDYFLVLNLGEEAPFADWDNFDLCSVPLVPATPSSQWPAGQPQTLEFRFVLPAWAPQGAMPARLQAYGMKHGTPLELRDAAGQALTTLGTLDLQRPGMQVASPGPVRLDNSTGALALARGKELLPANLWALRANSWERYWAYASTGNHIYHVQSEPLKVTAGPEGIRAFQQRLDQRISTTLRVDPQAQFLVMVDLRPAASWLEAHPEERLVTAQGTLGPVSYCSAAYFALCDQYLRELIGFFKTRPYYDRLVAYLIESCGSPDSTMGGTEGNLFQKDRAKITVGDFSPQAVAAFRAWLKAKYGTDAALQKAWHDPRATFAGFQLDIKQLVAEGAEGGVFRDPLTSGMTLDYFDFLSGVMGRYFSHVMATVKQAAGRPVLCGTYYGYSLAHLYGYNNPGGMFNGNNFDLYRRLQDPNWDFCAGPNPYESRAAGEPFKSYHAQASVRLHGKLLMNEMDHRTFIAAPTSYGRLHDAAETEGVLKRDAGGGIVDGSGYWFADWSGARGRDGVGFFTDPTILKTVRETTAASRRALQQKRTGGAEVALFVHGATMGAHDVYRSEPIYYNLVARMVWGEMSRMGAPYDTLLLEDLADKRVRDGYKLYVFLNPFLLSAQQRQQIADLKRAGKTILFLYAPGYADRATGLGDKFVSELTGFTVRHHAPTEIMRYRLTNTTHPITQGLAAGREYAIEPYGYEISRELHPPVFGPVFTIEGAGDAALATYPDGQVALAAKDMGTWKSVYCTVPYMGAELLRGVCRYAGVHLYTEENVVLTADNRCLMVHNGKQGAREVTVALPGERRVTDLCTGDLVAERTVRLKLTLQPCETRLLGLEATQR